MDYSPPGSSVEFSRQEYWSGLPFPSTGDHPNTGTKPRSPALQADSLPLAPPGKPQTGTYLGNTDTDTTHTYTHTKSCTRKKHFPIFRCRKTTLWWNYCIWLCGFCTKGRREGTSRAEIRWNFAIAESWLFLCHLTLCNYSLAPFIFAHPVAKLSHCSSWNQMLFLQGSLPFYLFWDNNSRVGKVKGNEDVGMIPKSQDCSRNKNEGGQLPSSNRL